VRKQEFKKMMSELKESKSAELIKLHKEFKEKWKSQPEGGTLKSYY